MKKLYALLVAAVISVSSVSALGLGVFLGGGVGQFKLLNSDDWSAWTWEVGGRLTLPHDYGNSIVYGQVELEYMSPIYVDVSYNIGLHIPLGSKVKLSPYVGLSVSYLAIGGNAGLELRVAAGTGDFAIDVRYDPLFGLFGRQPSIVGSIGYVFLFGSEKHARDNYAYSALDE